MLWSVIASDNIEVFKLVFILIHLYFFIYKSVNIKNAVPNMIPTVAASQPGFPWASEFSIAGIISDQIEAAIITPEANPKNIFCNLSLIGFLNANTTAAPNVVPKKGISIPIIHFKIFISTFLPKIRGIPYYDFKLKSNYNGKSLLC